MKYDELLNLARNLALALADEVTFAGADAAERSLQVLAQAREKLSLAKEFDEIESLSMQGT